ncbi:rRNA maturation RNase YbeY [Gemmatimonadota bacterium DH-20]|uniref:Endoribonuclease YbeY n=1 Tax=Gaopeijia maritima TaxID=3119007 RepID=A0ABU9EA40_9BACT
MIHVLLDAPEGVSDPSLLEAGVRRALRRRGVERAEVSVALVDDPAIHELNRRHLGHDYPTDVISFGLWQPGDPVVVGDIYIGWEQARRQAADLGVDEGEELLRLAVHGALHVAGMDHPDEAEQRAASEMVRLQEAVVRELLSGDGGIA